MIFTESVTFADMFGACPIVLNTSRQFNLDVKDRTVGYSAMFIA